WAVGSNGTILKTTNSGVNWIAQTSGTTKALTSINFIDSNTGWAVGASGTILKTTNGGEVWFTQSSGISREIKSVCFIDSNTGWVAYAGNILKTTDGGANWIEQIKRVSHTIQSVYFIDSNTGWAVGDNGTILSTKAGIPPLAPTNLVAVADLSGVILSWQDNSNNEEGFIIERKNDSLHIPGTWDIIGSVNANIPMYINTGLSPNTTYSYRVSAHNKFGISIGDSADVTTIIPVELTSFSAIVSENEVTLNWTTATELNNQGFEIERKFDSWEKIGYVPGFGTTTESKSYSFTDSKLNEGNYKYRLKQIDYDGAYKYSKELNVEVSMPLEFSLEQNYPNPFNPSTTIKYSIAEDGYIKLSVYNLLGEEVTNLVNGQQKAGRYEIDFNAGTLASGVYIYRLETSNFISSKKLMLMK
ncbi:MAG TPA: YCF48-related protein, partial [Ignavibacteriaceae bacterium]|nr:YCF48-related protein [Ignavibacteriaceae bacterium]